MPTDLKPRGAHRADGWPAAARVSSVFMLVAMMFVAVLVPVTLWSQTFCLCLLLGAFVLAASGIVTFKNASSSLALLWAAAAALSDEAAVLNLFSEFASVGESRSQPKG